jgi:hypothetical protein
LGTTEVRQPGECVEEGFLNAERPGEGLLDQRDECFESGGNLGVLAALAGLSAFSTAAATSTKESRATYGKRCYAHGTLL